MHVMHEQLDAITANGGVLSQEKVGQRMLAICAGALLMNARGSTMSVEMPTAEQYRALSSTSGSRDLNMQHMSSIKYPKNPNDLRIASWCLDGSRLSSRSALDLVARTVQNQDQYSAIRNAIRSASP
eukprot:3874149-Amphidinium_carterae.1